MLLKNYVEFSPTTEWIDDKNALNFITEEVENSKCFSQYIYRKSSKSNVKSKVKDSDMIKEIANLTFAIVKMYIKSKEIYLMDVYKKYAMGCEGPAVEANTNNIKSEAELIANLLKQPTNFKKLLQDLEQVNVLRKEEYKIIDSGKKHVKISEIDGLEEDEEPKSNKMYCYKYIKLLDVDEKDEQIEQMNSTIQKHADLAVKNYKENNKAAPEMGIAERILLNKIFKKSIDILVAESGKYTDVVKICTKFKKEKCRRKSSS